MFFGRTDILANLDLLWGKSVSSFVTCRGRRRIGKSTLIEVFAERSGARFIKIEGSRPRETSSDEKQRAAFAKQLRSQCGTEAAVPADWLDAFVRLSTAIRDGERTVVLLDEISWMAAFDDTFSDTLKIAWDNHLKKHDRLILVVCGSASAWIRDEIVDNRAFYGRRSLDVIVPELSIADCAAFWGERVSRTSSREILDILSVTGGVPRYLEEVNPSLTAKENLRRMCFIPKAPLRQDFDEMFGEVISRQPRFVSAVMRALIAGSRSVTEIARTLQVGKGGNITAALDQLEEAGLVSSDVGLNPETGAQVRERRYRLKDNYVRFYLKYIEPIKASIDNGAFEFDGLEVFSGWESVMGLAFENLVINHVRDLIEPLHLKGATILSAAPYLRRASERSGIRGCQVDLLIQTKSSLCVVEIKRQAKLGQEVIAEMKERIVALPHQPRATIRAALVYDGELARSVEGEGYFDAIVPFARLLG